MTDVLKIALERRTKLQEEIKRLDEFIRMADALVRSEAGGDKADSQPAQTTPVPAVATEAEAEAEKSPMRAAARKLSDAEVRRAPEAEAAQGADAPRPSIIRRGLAG